MLIQSIEVMKYVRASAGRVGISIVFEDTNKPRHDGKTIYLPKITAFTTDQELKDRMASVDHEVAHDRFSSFEVIHEKKPDPKGVLMFVWNFLEDSRINNIEALEYRGFRENWDETSSLIIGKILSDAKKKPSFMSELMAALLCWDGKVSASSFPSIELVTSKTIPNKKIFDVLNNFSDRLIHCHSILDKRLGTEFTYDLAVDILNELEHECKDEIKKHKEEAKSESVKEGKGKGVSRDSSKKTETGDSSDSSKGEGEVIKSDDDEYKIITIKLTEEELNSLSISMPDEGVGMGKTGINLEPVEVGTGEWELTDYDKFIVVDYPKHSGDEKYYRKSVHYSEFMSEYESRVGSKLVSQENFAQQVRKLIQIRAKVQRQYGVKKGKLDQSRLSRICFNAPGFNERVFKNKIDNKVLDASITVLVDMSGSMSGDKAYYALASTLLVNEVCSTLNIPIEIVGFSDGYDGRGDIQPLMFLYKSFSDLKVNEDQLKEYFACSSDYMVGNPDGENILWAHNRLIKRKEKKKLLIVMSDGSPAGTKHKSGVHTFTEKVIKEIEATKTVDIYGLGLASNSVTYYYKANSVVDNPAQIPSKLLELIERKVLNV
jgi:cobalamin biosynthesis protein CobT